MARYGKIARDEFADGARDQYKAGSWRNRNRGALHHACQRALSIARQALCSGRRPARTEVAGPSRESRRLAAPEFHYRRVVQIFLRATLYVAIDLARRGGRRQRHADLVAQIER